MTAKKTVVIVDDEPGFREILQDALEDEGYDVHSAADGAAALILLRGLTARPCIVLCDVMMPQLDGPSLLQTIKADPRLETLQFVFLSTDPRRAVDGVPFIKKPPNLHTIFDMVKKCCDETVSSVAS